MHIRYASPEQGPDQEHLRFYRGRSMTGTFRPGDYLIVSPVPFDQIQVGDVVVFRGQNSDPDESGDLVHRVVAARPGGLVTCGDYNKCNDSMLLTEENLIGRVTIFWRAGKIRFVRGGQPGMWRLRWQRAIRYAWQILRLVGRFPYRWLRESGLAMRLVPLDFQRLCLQTEDGRLVKFLHRGRTVACWWEKRNHFECRKPYDLWLGAGDLPLRLDEKRSRQ